MPFGAAGAVNRTPDAVGCGTARPVPSGAEPHAQWGRDLFLKTEN
jgi:hypothetical protein